MVLHPRNVKANGSQFGDWLPQHEKWHHHPVHLPHPVTRRRQTQLVKEHHNEKRRLDVTLEEVDGGRDFDVVVHKHAHDSFVVHGKQHPWIGKHLLEPHPRVDDAIGQQKEEDKRMEKPHTLAKEDDAHHGQQSRPRGTIEDGMEVHYAGAWP